MKWILIGLYFSVAPAYGQNMAQGSFPCHDTAVALNSIKNRHGNLAGQGLTATDKLIQVFEFSDHSFVVTETSHQGITCIMDLGSDWTSEKP